MNSFGILEPLGAYITVHKDWRKAPKNCVSKTESKRLPNSEHKLLRPLAKTYVFVGQNTHDGVIGPGTRKLIRTHVRNGRTERARTFGRRALSLSKQTSEPITSVVAPKTQSKSQSPAQSSLRTDGNTPGIPYPLGNTTALTSALYPITMHHRTYHLLSHYLTGASARLYPTSLTTPANPVRSRSWFHFAVTDAAMFQAMLYAGAVYLALLEGKSESWDTIYHQGEAIAIVNRKLGDGRAVEDATIGAITCLALGEAITGNREKWDIHMRGLRQILRKRGGVSSLGIMLRVKLQRSDVSGAIDYDARPYLNLERSDTPPIWSSLSSQDLKTIQKNTKALFAPCDIHLSLSTPLTELAYFSAALRHSKSNPSIPLNATAYSEDIYSLEYKLLTCPETTNSIENACRLGALIYIKTVLEEFPHSRIGAVILLQKLRAALRNISHSTTTMPILLWLTTLAASLSRGEELIYFLRFLKGLIKSCGVIALDDEELEMSSILPLQPIFGNSLKRLWQSAMAMP